MPQISRIRVNNIKYNFGTQFYDDFLMRFSGKNTIYDLANGGGKSVLMLLLLQNMIPNCTLDDKQPIEKLFRSGNNNTTIHSLVEWRLDSSDIKNGYRYMTTGFCARKGRDTGDGDETGVGVEYFNYCIFYRDFGENDIKNLPLVQNGERVTYNGLKAFLRDLEKKDPGVSVRIFDRKGDYQNFIGEYGIYESQWEIIKGINRTEGHVRTYFENSYRTTRRVIEDLLIEEIIEKSYNNRIRRSGETDDGMADTLLDIKDRLMDLARKRGDIGAYDIQVGELENFAGGLNPIRELYVKKQEAQYRLVHYLDVCNHSLTAFDREKNRREEEINSLRDEARQSAASYERALIESEYAELDGVEELLKETLDRRETLKKGIEEQEKNIKTHEAANAYMDYKAEKAKYEETRTLIASLGTDRPEITAELGNLCATLEKLYADRQELLTEKLMALEDVIKASESDLMTTSEEALKAYGLMEKYEALGAEHEERENALLNELEELMRGLELVVAENAAEQAKLTTERLAKSEKIIRESRKKFEENLIKSSELSGKLYAIDEAVELGRENIKKIELELQVAEENGKKYDSLKQVYDAADPEQLTDITGRLYENLTREKLLGLQEEHNLKAYADALEHGRIYMADSEREALFKYLKGRYGENVIGGEEYIGRLAREEQKKVMADCPALPYFILAGESCEQIINDPVIHKMTTGGTFVPIVSGLSDVESMAAAYRDYGFLWDENALKAEKDRVAEELSRLEERMERLEDKIAVVREDLHFSEKYLTENKPDILRQQVFAEKNRIAELTEAGDRAGKEIERLSALNEELKNTAALEEKRVAELNGDLKKYEAIALKQRECDECRRRGKATAGALLTAKTSYGKLTADREAEEIALKDHRTQAELLRNRLNALSDEFDNEYRQYVLPSSVIINDISMEDACTRANALKAVLKETLGDLSDKQKLLTAYELQMKKSLQTLTYKGMQLNQAERLDGEGLLVPVTLEKLLELNGRLESDRTLFQQLTGEADAQSARKNRIEGGLSHSMGIFEEKYGPFARENIDNPGGSAIKRRVILEQAELKLKKAMEELKAFNEGNRDAVLIKKDLERTVLRFRPDYVPEPMSDVSTVITMEMSEEAVRELEKLSREESRLRNEFEGKKKQLTEKLELNGARELALEFNMSLVYPDDVPGLEELLQGLSETCECIRLERNRIEKSIEDMEQIRDNFVNRCVQICTNIRTELDRLGASSRITLENENISVIMLSIPYIKEEMYKERMTVYINETVSVAETFEGREDKLKYIRGRLSWKKLFSVIVSDMNSIRLSLYKREHIKDQSRYLKYEEAVGSTGQSQGIYIQFLIAIINYIAALNAAGRDSAISGKTIFIDNPFGAAKDVYIWEPIFKLLKTNHVQLIVPARGATPAITKLFDVNYILGQKMSAGRQQTVVVDYHSQVQTEEMDYETLDYEQSTWDFL